MKKIIILVAVLAFALGVVATLVLTGGNIPLFKGESEVTESESDDITDEESIADSITESKKETESAAPETTTTAPETTTAAPETTTAAPETTTVAPETTTVAPETTTATPETTTVPETTTPDTPADSEAVTAPETQAPSDITIDLSFLMSPQVSEIIKVPDEFFASSLFIGDSRTVGLSCYADLSKATVFCTKGMDVFRVFKETVEVPRYGPSTLDNTLQMKTYDKIYLMLGLNEIGYSAKAIMTKYTELLVLIRSYQPDAKIYLMANLHTTSSRSNTDSIYNNVKINELNKQIAAIANGKTSYYLDANVLFDDETGGLCADYAVDDFHLKKQYYPYWVKWIALNSAIE